MNLRMLILFLVLLLGIYQDFPLVNTFGEIARSPIVFMMPFFILYFLCKKKIIISSYSKVFIIYIVYLMIISLIYSIFLIIKNKSLFIFEENILIKNVKMLSYPVCALLFYQFIYLFLKRTVNLAPLLKIVFYVQILLMIILFFESQVYKTEQTFLSFLHSDPSKYWRIRLLTMESSWSGSVVIIFTFVPIFLAEYLNEKKYKKIAIYLTSLFFFFYYTFHSESKGYLLLLLISLLPMLLRYMYAHKRLRYVLLMAIIPLFISFVTGIKFLNEEIFSQLNSSITFGTRFTGYLTSLKTFLTNPFGIGLGPFMEIYTESIGEIISSDFMKSFNTLEVAQYLHTPKNLSSKTYFFDHLVFGGVFFLIFFYYFFIKRISGITSIRNNYLLKTVLIYIILSSIFYLTFHIKYEVWFFLAFIDYLENNVHKKA